MEAFYLKIYLFKDSRLPPIKIARNSQLQITAEFMDYTIPDGAEVSAFATGLFPGLVFTQGCTVDGNRVTFTPKPGFFVQGKNILQYKINNGVIPLAIDVSCEVNISATGDGATPEQVLPYVTRAENAAESADKSAKAAQDALDKTAEIAVNTPRIGENGNWFVFDAGNDSYVDSGVRAQGEPGAPGRNGSDGKPGAPGAPGAPGYTPVYGVDYGTPDQIDGIAHQAAEILQPEVNQIKDDIVNINPMWLKGAKEVGFNLFNKYSTVNGFYVNSNNGELVANELYCSSDFIEIDNTLTYTTSTGFHGAWYDENKTFISGFNKLTNTLPPNNAKYARVDCYISNKDTFVFCFGFYYNFEKYEVELEWLKDKSFSIKDLETNGSYFLNLFDKNLTFDDVYINELTGEVLFSSSYFRSDFIEIKPNVTYKKNSSNRYAFFTDKKFFISGGQGYEITSPSNAKYIVISDAKTLKDTLILSEKEHYTGDYKPYSIYIPWIKTEGQIIPKSKYDGKKMVCFGDSITNMGYTDTILNDTGIIATNVGLSSGRYAHSDDSNQYVNAFAFHNIVDSIVSGDWTIPDTIQDVSGYETQYEHIQTIKAINFNEIDFVSIAYGTNDFSSATPMDNPDNKYDVNYFKGAMRYCIRKLTESYPHLKIIISTPIYRFWVNSGDVVDDCTTHTIGDFLLSDYNEAEKTVCEEFNLPCINNLENGGINEFNRLHYFNISDGLHPNRNGLSMIGHRIGNGILANY